MNLRAAVPGQRFPLFETVLRLQLQPLPSQQEAALVLRVRTCVKAARGGGHLALKQTCPLAILKLAAGSISYQVEVMLVR